MGTCFYPDNLTNFYSSFNSYFNSCLLWHLQVSWWLLPLGTHSAWTYMFHTYLLICGCLSYLNLSFSISWCISILFFSSLRGQQQCNNCLGYKWRQKEKSLQNGFIFTAAAATAAKSLQSCPTLCDPIDGNPPGSAVPGILQSRTLEWVAISFSFLLSTY